MTTSPWLIIVCQKYVISVPQGLISHLTLIIVSCSQTKWNTVYTFHLVLNSMQKCENETKYSNPDNSDLVFVLTKTLLTHATITHKQNNRFALVLTHSYTIISPTTVAKEVSMRYWVCSPLASKRFVTYLGNSNRHGVIQITKLMTYLTGVLGRNKGVRKKYTSYSFYIITSRKTTV